jgi:hypothetical protein
MNVREREREREEGDDSHTLLILPRWLGLNWNLGRTNGSDDVLGLLLSRTLMCFCQNLTHRGL